MSSVPRKSTETGEQQPPRHSNVRRSPTTGPSCPGRRCRWFLCALSLAFSLAATTNRWSSRSDQPGTEDVSFPVGVADTAAARSDGRRRVAVCFFGLTRSLRWTLPGLQRRLLGVLKEAGMAVDVFVHTYALEEVRLCVACAQGHQIAYQSRVAAEQVLRLQPGYVVSKGKWKGQKQEERQRQ